MPTTTEQDRRFATERLSGVLEDAMSFLLENLDTEDIVPEGALVEWARENAAKHLNPEDVFSADDLRVWAIDAGYQEP